MCNIYISRNLATQRENICAMLNYVSEILALYYTTEVYRNKCPQKIENDIFLWPNDGDSDIT